MNPIKKLANTQNQIQWNLANNIEVTNWDDLDETLQFIQQEYDCSDFRLVNLIRILYESGEQIPLKHKTNIENILFGFRYWWDDPGKNSMCYWTENHQILFASAEYLVGQLYPNQIFSKSGLTGEAHKAKAKQRILDWLEMRWNYGFIEFNSGVYYKEDIGALINLIDFSEDEELVKKSQIIMDLLFYDVASQNIQTMFISASGRAYLRNRTGSSGSRLGGITEFYWGNKKPLKPGLTYGLTTTQKYNLPPVLLDIAKDSSQVVLKQSHGLNIPELKTEGYYGTDNRSMMMQWGMQAFSNPEVVRNSLSHIRNSISFSNQSVAAFKTLDFTVLKWLHLEPTIIKMINPQSNGVAIQKANTYTYKTKDYSLYTVQNYHPGTYSYQQHVFGMNIKNYFAVYHNHPALKKDKKHHSPGYEVGYGHLPHAVQDKNVSLAIYNIPDKKGIMEMELLDFTRAFFPSNKFDSTHISKNYMFGKKGNTYCAFIGTNDFYFSDETKNDIIQPGKQTFWITEAGSQIEDGTFKNFIQRIKSNEITFNSDSLNLTYNSRNTLYKLKYKANFLVDGELINTEYSRFDSPYVKAKKKDKTITIKHNGKSLFLDFYNLKRIEL